MGFLWSEAGKKRLAGDTAREASSDEVKQLRTEAASSRRRWPRSPPENRLPLTIADLPAAILVDDGEHNQAEAQESPKIEKGLRFVG